jgi:hypothetical protein
MSLPVPADDSASYTALAFIEGLMDLLVQECDRRG